MLPGVARPRPAAPDRPSLTLSTERCRASRKRRRDKTLARQCFWMLKLIALRPPLYQVIVARSPLTGRCAALPVIASGAWRHGVATQVSVEANMTVTQRSCGPAPHETERGAGSPLKSERSVAIPWPTHASLLAAAASITRAEPRRHKPTRDKRSAINTNPSSVSLGGISSDERVAL